MSFFFTELKDDFQSVLRSLSTLMFINIDMKLWIYFMKIVAKCLHFVTSRMKQNKKLSRVRSTDWKSSLTRVVNYFRLWTTGFDEELMPQLHPSSDPVNAPNIEITTRGRNTCFSYQS